MRLRHIEIFFAVWRNGSVTAAAEELAISQSSVSKTLKHSEQLLGFQLFNRVRGKLVLTEEGEILLLDAEVIFDALERVRSRAGVLKNGIARSIRMVCLPSLGMWLIPQAVVRFRNRHPGIALEVATKHEGEMLEGIRSRQFDLAFGFGPSTNHPVIPGLRCDRLAKGRLVYIEPAGGQPGGWVKPVSLDAIDYKRLIGLNGQHFLGNALHTMLRASGMPDQPSIQVQTYYIARALTAFGAGCAIVDEYTAMTEPGELTIRPLDPEISFGIYLYRREDRNLSRAEQELVDKVAAVCKTRRQP